MLPRGRIPLGLFVFSFALFSATLVAGQTLQDRRQELAAAQRLAARAAQQARQLEEQALEEREAARSAQWRAAALAARIQATEAGIGAAEAHLLWLRAMTEDVRARLAERQRPAAKLLAALQIFGRRPLGMALAQPNSVRDMVHVRMILAAIQPEIERRTAGLQRDLGAKRALEVRAERVVRDLGNRKEQLREERRALVALETQHRAKSQLLVAGAMAEQDRALAMGEDARDLAELISQMGILASRQADLASLPGPLLRPIFPSWTASPPLAAVRLPALQKMTLRLPVAGVLIRGFGEIEPSGARSRGLTFKPQPGAQVVAPAAGRVIYAGPFRGYRDIVILDHGVGRTSVVTGISRAQVRVGEQLIMGSPMGTASSPSPEVRLEVRQDEQPVDVTRFVI